VSAEVEPEVPSLHFRSRTLFLYITAGALLLIGIALRNPVPLFLALPLLLAPIAAGLTHPRRGSFSARLAWREEGSGLEVRLDGSLTLDPGLSAQDLEVDYARPALLSQQSAPTESRHAERLEFVLNWRAPHPCLVTVAPPSAVWSDALGLAERHLSVEGTELRIARFPPELTRLGTVRLRRTIVLPGEIRSRAAGRAGEFFSVREAGSTDTPRQINWRASARAGRLLANDFFLERTGDILLILDLRPTALGPELDQALLSISAAAAFGMAQAFLRRKARVGLGMFGEFLEAIRLGSGRIQSFQIRQSLLEARLTNSPGPSERLAVALPRYFPPGVNTVIFSSMNDESAQLLLPYLRRRGFPLLVVSPSPLPLLVSPPERASPDDQLANRLLELIRRRTLQAVWEEAPVIDWRDYWSLEPFVRLLSSPPRNRSAA